jgi:RNA polymerase sigma factor (sigma-70 family)
MQPAAPAAAPEHPTADANRRARAERLATEIYAKHRPHLLRIATRNALSPEDAEDALQDAFIIFAAKFDPDGEAHPLAWLTLVLKRECWGRRKRERLDRRALPNGDPEALDDVIASIPDTAHTPDARAELADRAAEIGRHMAALKPQERRALSLLALGFTYREIGELTGWTYTKINRCIAEGRARIRALDSNGSS